MMRSILAISTLIVFGCGANDVGPQRPKLESESRGNDSPGRYLDGVSVKIDGTFWKDFLRTKLVHCHRLILGWLGLRALPEPPEP
jgi:hypothetical protein